MESKKNWIKVSIEFIISFSDKCYKFSFVLGLLFIIYSIPLAILVTTLLSIGYYINEKN